MGKIKIYVLTEEEKEEIDRLRYEEHLEWYEIATKLHLPTIAVKNECILSFRTI